MTFFGKSFVSRLVAGFLVLSLLAVAATSLVAFSVARKILYGSVYDRLTVAATLKENELDRWIEDQKQEVVYLAKSPAIRDNAAILIGRDENHPYYQQAHIALTENCNAFIKRNPYFREIEIISAEGVVLHSTQIEHEKSFHNHDTFFLEGLKNTYIQNVYPSSSNYEPTLTVATPMTNEFGIKNGVLAVHFNLEWMNRLIIENIGLGETGVTYLIDQYGDFVTQVYGDADDYPGGVHTEGIDAAISGKNGFGQYLNFRGEQVLGVYRWLEERQLALLCEISTEEALAPARSVGMTIILFGSFISVLSAVAIYLLARQIAKPVISMAKTSSRIADGDLDLNVPVKYDDEVGELARSFNRMVEQLRNMYLTASRSEEKYRLLVENQTDMVVKIDPEMRLLFASPSFCEMFGVEENEVLGKKFTHFDTVQDEESLAVFVNSMLSPPYSDFHEHQAETEFGMRWFAWVSTAVLDADGGLAEIVSVGRDVTDRKMAEVELEKYQKNLESIIEERTSRLRDTQSELLQKERLAALGQLAATVSHEIRNPLGTIRNAVYSLDEAITRSEYDYVSKMTELAERNIDRCDRIINEMLDFTRNRQLIEEQIDFDQWLEALLDEQTIPDDIQLQRDLKCGSVVNFDTELLRRVILNILTNAFQAFDGKENDVNRVTMSSRLLQEAGELEVTISDNGCGISEENMAKIFEPLFSTKGFGVGLGMAIVKNIIEDHSGELLVDSLPGDGTSVTFRIPVKAKAASADE